MKVAPQEVDCVGVAPMRCLNVQIGSNNRWEPLYQGITDFSYSPGYTYELEVREVHIANPPADASSIEYQLIKINSKTPA